MKEMLMERLKTFLLREDNSTLLGSPASEEEIEAAQQELGIRFHEDYVQFIRTFGGAYIGLPVYAFSNGSSIGNRTIVDMTLYFREELKEQPPFAELLPTSYVVSMDGLGDPIIIDQAGKVFLCFPHSGEIKLLAESFEALIEENFQEW